MPIFTVQSNPVMLAGNQTRDIIVGFSTPFAIGIFVGICIATQAAPGSGDVSILSISANDGGGSPQLRYTVRNNRPTASEFVRTSLVANALPPP
jgi:hypothetical protein